ncbi:hypothetical protein FQR65_LT03073 [Abscondita terminalis]|nr:hypothetical protein FQR65_LT03073 [Abscondita terminalis]
MENSNIRKLIKNTSIPLLISNALNWELLQWDVKKWSEILGNENLQFRRGYNKYTKSPQFENTCDIIQLTFEKFLNYVENNKDEWLYFDYKYLKTHFLNIPELHKYITWNALGFSEYNVTHSTFWLGSKGAHTPCHQDTYGCNIVVQVYGRKRWFLFPPNEDLQPTRVPYEESSIYSKINMFTPDLDDFNEVCDCRSVTLNPGDVLIVPHKWWHYVENLEVAISINMWIDLPVDHEERINESIVQMLISQLSSGLSPKYVAYIFNPDSKLDDVNLIDAFRLTRACLKNYKEDHERISTAEVQKLIDQFDNIDVVGSLDSDDKLLLIHGQQKNINCIVTDGKIIDDDDKKLIHNYLDAVLHNDVINMIKNKLLKLLFKFVLIRSILR